MPVSRLCPIRRITGLAMLSSSSVTVPAIRMLCGRSLPMDFRRPATTPFGIPSHAKQKFQAPVQQTRRRAAPAQVQQMCRRAVQARARVRRPRRVRLDHHQAVRQRNPPRCLLHHLAAPRVHHRRVVRHQSRLRRRARLRLVLLRVSHRYRLSQRQPLVFHRQQ